MLNTALLYQGIYGVLLGLLILSWYVHEFFIRLFVQESYDLGNFGQTWANWHAIGCFYVGWSSLFAYQWAPPLLEAQRQIALLVSTVYGIWTLQNLYLMCFTQKMKPMMWLHVAGCFVGALLGYWGLFL